jgi:hypothetical protein
MSHGAVYQAAANFFRDRKKLSRLGSEIKTLKSDTTDNIIRNPETSAARKWSLYPSFRTLSAAGKCLWNDNRSLLFQWELRAISGTKASN